MPLVLRGIGLESGILVQKFAVRQGSAPRPTTIILYSLKTPPSHLQFLITKAIPHNSKCRYGERGAAAAKPKAQIILDVLSSILATQMPCRSRRSGA